MKETGKNISMMLTGVAIGAVLAGGSIAAAAGIVAEPTWQPIFVDGRQVQMTAYNIAGHNYVKLRDIGEKVGFNVYWSDGVQVDSDAPYTGEAPKQEAAQSSTGQDLSECRQEIVDRTNALRREHGLPTFTANDKLMQAAQVRAEEMAENSLYSHTRPDDSQYYTVTDCPYTAENIHRIATRYLTQHGVGLAEAAVDGWVNSETHLRNILNDRLSSIGVGIAKGVNASGEESWYCVQLFLYNGYSISWVDESIM